MSEQELRNALYGFFKNRAMMYYYIFDEMRKEIGEEKAAEIMARGIYKRGLDMANNLQHMGRQIWKDSKTLFYRLCRMTGK